MGWTFLAPVLLLTVAAPVDAPFPLPFPLAADADRLTAPPPAEPVLPPTPLLGAPNLLPSWTNADSLPRRARNTTAGAWGSIQSQVQLRDGEDAAPRSWQRDDAFKTPTLGPFHVFGQLGSALDDTAADAFKVVGGAGLACQVPLGADAEVVLRGGPRVTYTDPLATNKNSAKSEMLLEVQARCPLLFGVGFEFSGQAIPALTPADRDTLSQDIRLAVPLGDAGKFRVGARRKWESAAGQGTWSDTSELYLGLELTR